MKYSKKELKDLFFAWILISLAFAILFSGGILNVFNSLFLTLFLISAFTAGVGFVFHELMHKYYAQKYRLWAEFRASYKMLFLAIVFSLFGFIIAAPGAVIIQGKTSESRKAKISLAGPMTNIILAGIFLTFLILISSTGITGMIFKYGTIINSVLGLFNLIPIKPFDGKDIYTWNKKIFFATALTGIIILISAIRIEKILALF